MKKLLAALLAVAMVLSMSAVSFAADETAIFTLIGTRDGALHYDADHYYADKYGDYLMMDNNYISYGASAYFPIYYCIDHEGDGVDPNEDLHEHIIASDSDLIDNLKVKVEYEEGEELISNVSIVKMRVDNAVKPLAVAAGVPQTSTDKTIVGKNIAALNTALVGNNNYYYFVKMDVKPAFTSGAEDVIGTFEFSSKQDKEVDIVHSCLENGANLTVARDAVIAKVKGEDCKVPFAFEARLERHYTDPINKDNSLVKDDTVIENGKGYSLKFDCDDEVEFTFAASTEASPSNGFSTADANEGTFTVDVSGQGKVIMMFTTDAIPAIAEAHPEVDMHFVNFNNVKFNRAGTYEYEMDNGVAAYQIKDGKLAPIPGCEFDGDTFTFKTNVLGQYVFASAELM